MRKKIDFPPYSEAQIKAINEDGSVLCDLFGENYNDTDISFPRNSEILSLTPEQIEQYTVELAIKIETLAIEPA